MTIKLYTTIFFLNFKISFQRKKIHYQKMKENYFINKFNTINRKLLQVSIKFSKEYKGFFKWSNYIRTIKFIVLPKDNRFL
jgi:hypothetical protein